MYEWKLGGSDSEFPLTDVNCNVYGINEDYIDVTEFVNKGSLIGMKYQGKISMGKIGKFYKSLGAYITQKPTQNILKAENSPLGHTEITQRRSSASSYGFSEMIKYRK